MDASTDAPPAVPNIKVFADPAALAVAGAELVLESAIAAVAAGGSFSIVLAGGSTPKALYALLTAEPYRARFPWADTEFYFGDERCVPPEHADSNYRMALEALLSKAPVVPANVHRMRGELPAEEAAREYGQMLRDRFGDTGPDLVLLGMGDDGHTLSLFPNAPVLDEQQHRCVGYFAPNSSTGKSWRITMTAAFVNRARHAVFLVAGKSKTARLAEVIEGPRDPHRLPAQLIAPSPGLLSFYIDAAAAGMDEVDD